MSACDQMSFMMQLASAASLSSPLVYTVGIRACKTSATQAFQDSNHSHTCSRCCWGWALSASWTCLLRSFTFCCSSSSLAADLFSASSASCQQESEDQAADTHGADKILAAGNQRGTKRKRLYDEHRPMSDITNGIKSGSYHQVHNSADHSYKMRW